MKTVTDPPASPALTLLDALEDPELFGRAFQGPSWGPWRAFLAALFALPLSEAEREVYTRHTGRQRPPEQPAREGWVICGRRSGKSRIAALVAVYLATFRDYGPALAPGEKATVMLLAADRRQARVLMRYVTGLLDSVPMLARLVVTRTAESVELASRVVIEIHTASFRAIRGYTIAAAICDELAFWRSEDSANPDVEILAGLRPGMATVPGSLLLCISSPYARRGALWEAYGRHHGQDGDPVLVWQADTRSMNATVDERIIAEAYQEDESAARAEWGAEFRSDLEEYVSREALQKHVIPGRRELGPSLTLRYRAFCDPAGGSGGDSMTLAIAHTDPRSGQVVLDLILEARPPFSPDEVVEQFSQALTAYGVGLVVGDRYAGDWPASRFRAHRITYQPSEKTKSAIYAELLPLLNSGAVELLDDRRLLGQLLALERRTSWGGRDSVDHPPGGHDDLANAAAGALVLAAGSRRRGELHVFARPEITELGDPVPAAQLGIKGKVF